MTIGKDEEMRDEYCQKKKNEVGASQLTRLLSREDWRLIFFFSVLRVFCSQGCLGGAFGGGALGSMMQKSNTFSFSSDSG